MDFNKHKFLLSQILLDIFKDITLNSVLAFKGGTSLMMFYNLNRFSTDLDFNLLDNDKMEYVHMRIHDILRKYGKIDDEALKFYGSVIVLNYGIGERKLKVEVSNRQYDNHYEKKNLFNTDINVMTIPDMFAHKLCALGERCTPRDIFDIWFLMFHRYDVNDNIVRLRTGMSIGEYIYSISDMISDYSPKMLMQGLGDVVNDSSTKNFVRKNLIPDTVNLLKIFAANPLIAHQAKTQRLLLIEQHPQLLDFLSKNDIDLSIISEKDLLTLSGGSTICAINKSGHNIEISPNVF